MSDALPPEIQATEIPGGIHYRLPPRALGGLHHGELGLIVLGDALALLARAAAVVLRLPLLENHSAPPPDAG